MEHTEIVTERPTLSAFYSHDVVLTAQYLGAKVTGDNFFPRWMVNKFYRKGLIKIKKLDDVKMWEVAVSSPDGNITIKERVKFVTRERRE